jgi:hypothetical protein
MEKGSIPSVAIKNNPIIIKINPAHEKNSAIFAFKLLSFISNHLVAEYQQY